MSTSIMNSVYGGTVEKSQAFKAFESKEMVDAVCTVIGLGIIVGFTVLVTVDYMKQKNESNFANIPKLDSFKETKADVPPAKWERKTTWADQKIAQGKKEIDLDYILAADEKLFHA